MLIVDAQVHEPSVSLAWEGVDEAIRHEVLTELQLGYMRAVGVDRAILFPIDLAWGEEAAALLPERFGVVPMITDAGSYGGIDAAAPDLDEIVAAKRANPAIVGIRIVNVTPTPEGEFVIDPLETFDRAVAACAREGLPIFMSTAGNLSAPAVFAKRHPELLVIVDHLGIPQQPSYRRDTPTFRALPELVALARLPNVAVKLTGVPTLSDDRYPFDDLWPHLEQIVAAFGAERLMWGSDISRVMGKSGFDFMFPRGLDDYPGKHTYAEALLYMRETDRLSQGEKEWILGRTAETLLPWTV